MVHRSSDLLQRFALGELDGDARAAVVEELARCAECRAIVGAFVRTSATGRSEPRTVPSGNDATGDRIAGRYRIESKLGEGGMGVVYRVEHELLGRTFALKRLRGDRGEHEGAVRRFLLEARALAALGHEGIVDIVDVGHDERGRPFFVMPLLEGETLEARLAREATLPLAEACEIALRIADALAAAHRRGVVHRDVKPANVFLVRTADAVKLLDFGLAKLERDVVEAGDPSLTRTGAILGTPRYMAPEQWAGAHDVDARADVFAWGVTTYRMLTGGFPYELVPSAPASAPDVRRARPDVPLELAALVERAIASDRRARPDDASSVADAWRSAIERYSPRPAAIVARTTRPMRSERPAANVVGRRATVLSLAERLDAGVRVLAIVGPEGIGKTAVLEALRLELASRGQSVAQARTASSRSVPMAALRHLVEEEVASGTPVEVALRTALGRQDLTLFVESPAALDRESRRLVLAVAREGGAAIVMEARDDDTLGSASPDTEHLLAQATRVPLGGLDPQAVSELARGRGVTLDPGQLEALVARTGGHPLFVLTCLALHRERTQTDVPDDLADAILARLGAAPWREARAWQLAAVLGAEIAIDDLRALGASDADASVAWLIEHGVLREVDERLAFTAGLYAEVAARVLSADEAAHLHRSAAALRTRRLSGAHLPEAWATIAAHHERAGDLARAADGYALAALGPRAAPSQIERPTPTSWSDAGVDRRARWASLALELAARSSTARSDAGELALARIEGLAGEGRFEEASTAIDALDETAIAPETRARALVEKGTYLQRAGRHDEALRALAAAEGAAREAGAPSADTLALAIGRHAVSLALAGRVDDARDRLWQAEEIVLTRATSRRADLAGWKAQVAGLSGDLAERRDAYWAAAELFRAEGNARFAAFSLLNLGDTYARLGAYEEAERALVRAERECGALGAATMAGYAALNLGYVLARLGKNDEAAHATARALAIADRADDRRLARYAVLYAARLRTAPEALDRLVALEDDAGVTGHDPTWSALRDATLAEAALDAGRLDEALDRARRARARADEAGALEEGEADVDLVLVRALDARGETSEASAVARRASMRIREVARRIAGAHWRAFFLQDVPAHRALLSRS